MASCIHGCGEQHGLLEGECRDCRHAANCAEARAARSMLRSLRLIAAYADVCLDGGKHHALEEVKRMADIGMRRGEA
jgi:hypothetical protein